MAAIKYDVSDVEAGGGGEQPQPAMYLGKIVNMTNRKKKTDGSAVNDLETVVDVGEGYARLWTYIKLPGDPSFEQSKWKLRELTDALGIPPKGSIDPVLITKQQPAVMVKVSADTDQDGEYKGRIKNLFKPVEGAEAEGNGAVEPTGEGEDYTEWTDQDLKDQLAEDNITVAGRWSREKAIEALGGGAAADSTSEAEIESDEATQEGDDYDNWSLEDLAQEAEAQGIAGNVTGRKTKEKYIEALRSLASGPTPDAPATEVDDDYDEWPVEELIDEIKTRAEAGAEIELTGRKTKEKAIDALREDDAKASKEPF